MHGNQVSRGLRTEALKHVSDEPISPRAGQLDGPLTPRTPRQIRQRDRAVDVGRLLPPRSAMARFGAGLAATRLRLGLLLVGRRCRRRVVRELFGMSLAICRLAASIRARLASGPILATSNAMSSVRSRRTAASMIAASSNGSGDLAGMRQLLRARSADSATLGLFGPGVLTRLNRYESQR